MRTPFKGVRCSTREARACRRVGRLCQGFADCTGGRHAGHSLQHASALLNLLNAFASRRRRESQTVRLTNSFNANCGVVTSNDETDAVGACGLTMSFASRMPKPLEQTPGSFPSPMANAGENAFEHAHRV